MNDIAPACALPALLCRQCCCDVVCLFVLTSHRSSHRRPFQQLHCQSNDVKVLDGGSGRGVSDPTQLPPLSDNFKLSTEAIKADPPLSGGRTAAHNPTPKVVEVTPSTSTIAPSAEIPPELREVLGTEMPGVSDQDIEQDLAEFLDTGPLLQACQSPNLSTGGALDPVDLM